MKTQRFPAKPPCQKPTLKLIEWGVQNVYLAKNGVLPITSLLFLKILFQFKKLLKRVDLMYRLPKLHKLIWCTSYLSLSAGVSLKGAFFPASILSRGCLSIICVKEIKIEGGFTICSGEKLKFIYI